MRKFFFLTITLLLLVSANAQVDSVDVLNINGSMNIDMDRKIANVIAARQPYAPPPPVQYPDDIVNGYRLMIFHGTKQDAMGKLKQFQSLFPSLATTMIHEAPEFKILAGYYLNKGDANKDWLQVKRYFPAVIMRRANFKKKLALK